MAIPDAIAANATWDAWCAVLRARITAKNAGQHALAQAELDRLKAWYTANSVDPAGCWDVGRWVLSGDRVLSRVAWEEEERKTAEELEARHG
jgi:hypothetical protein